MIIGTSGYVYADWKGVFYPESLDSRYYFEHYNRFFNGLEINYTFYRLPLPQHLQQYCRSGFTVPELTVKAFQGITHASGSTDLVQDFFHRLSPLIRSGRTRTVLFQFPYSFRPCKQSWNQLAIISENVTDLDAVVEFRHDSWFTSQHLNRLSQQNLIAAAVDMPDHNNLPGTRFPITHSTGYMRFHGRNSLCWWNHSQPWERYNYLYSIDELEKLMPKIDMWVNQHQKTYLFFNNHYRGQAVQNAQQLLAFFADR